MIERLMAGARSLDEHRKIGARLLLPDEFGKPLRPQRAVDAVFGAALGREQARRRIQAILTTFVPCCTCWAAARGLPRQSDRLHLARLPAPGDRNPRSIRGSCRRATPRRCPD